MVTVLNGQAFHAKATGASWLRGGVVPQSQPPSRATPSLTSSVPEITAPAA